MNRQEASKLVYKIKARYPNAYAKFSGEDMLAVIEAWAEDFEHVPFAMADAALKQFALNDTQGYAPTSGQLMQYIDQAAHPNDLSGPAAWDRVLSSARCDPQAAADAFERLDPVIRRTIGSPSFLIELGWANAESNSVRQSLFERAYLVEMERERENRKVSPKTWQALRGEVRKELGDGMG